MPYKRVLLKLSGEALQGTQSYGVEARVLDRLVQELKEIQKKGTQVGVVIGGGNIFRGKTLAATGVGRITGDQLGMLATIMNGLVLRDALEAKNIPTRLFSAISMSGVIDQFDRRKAIHHLSEGRIVIFTAGTGNPLFTTDSAASLRAIEIEADILLKATHVDGIYCSDPAKNKQAKLYQKVSYEEVLQKELGIMDLAAFTQCRDYHLKMRVFNIHKPGALARVVAGEDEGTLVE